MKKHSSLPYFLFSTALGIATHATAGTTWDGGGVDDNWGTAANWNPDGAPPVGATVDLTFDGSTRLNSVNNYTAFDDFHTLTFASTAGAFALSGSAIDLFGKIENYSAATQTIGMDLAINAGQPGTGEFNPINGDIVINSANVFTNGNTLHVYGTNGKTVTFGASTVISQAGHFNVEQASNVVFLGNNTYTGTTNVLAGTLTVGNGGTTGSTGTGTVTVASGASLTYNRSDAITISNILAGAGNYLKAGAGSLTLGGANSFTGTLTVSNGSVLGTTNSNALGGGSLVLGDANTGANNVSFLTTTVGTGRPITVSASGTGTATIGSATGGTGNVNFTGQVTLNRSTTLTAASTDRTTWAGKITGNVGTLSIAGGFRTVFESASGANDFVGNIVVSGTNTVLQIGAGTGTGENIPNTASVTVQAGTFLKLASVAGNAETINAINGSGTIRRHEGVPGLQTLTIGAGNGSGSFDGVLENGGGSLALIKSGSGTQTLNRVGGNNAAVSSVTVNAGALTLVHTTDNFDRGYFPAATPITINAGGTLNASSLWTIKSTNVVTVNGGTLNFNTPASTTSDTNYVNNLTLQNGATISGPGGFRAGNVASTLTLNSTGNLTNTISTNLFFIKLGGITTYAMSVADGTAAVDLDISGNLLDSPSFTGMNLSKTGAGNMRLSGTNTFIGSTTISTGTLTLGAGGTTGSLAGAIINNSTLALDRSGTATVSNLISGTGALNHIGTSTTTLTGANTYTGPTTVTTGTLITTPLQTGATNITVADGATFGVKLNTVGTTFNTPSLTAGTTTGATLFFDTGALGNPTAAMINATTFTPTAATTLRLVGTNLVAGPTFTLLDYTGSIGGTGFAGLSLSLPFRVGGTLVNNTANTSVDVTISGVETAKWQGNVNGDWDIDPNGGNTAGTFNWKTSLLGTSTRYAQGVTNTDTVTFDDTATGTTNVNLTTTLTPVALTVNNTSLNYTFTGTGKISGTTGLTKQGNGTLTLANTAVNDYSGATTISGGTLQLGDGTTVGGGAVSGTITNNSTLAFNRPDDVAVANIINGNGSVLKTGAGKITLSSANGYSGGTTVSKGTLEGQTNTSFGSGTITLGDANTGAANVALYLANRADISNPITVSALGSGTVILGANNTGSGANAASFLGTLTLNRPTTFSGEVAADRLAIDGKVTGNVGTLTISGGSRTTFLSTLNDFVGDILVTGTGTTFQPSVATAAEVIPDASSVTVDAGAIMQLASVSGTETINALNGAGIVRTFLSGTFGSGLAVGSANGSGNFSGSLQNGTAGNPLSLTKLGTGTQTLSGNNTYTGATNITGGTLALSGSGSLADTNAVTLTASGSSFDIPAITGSEKIGSLAGVAGSTVNLGAKTLEFGDANSVAFAGGFVGSGGSIIKAGAGVQTLSGTNTYTGATNLKGGTLLLGSALALPSTAEFNLSTGTTLQTAGFSNSTGTINFASGTAIFDFSGSASTIAFADIGTWGGVLQVWNYEGSVWDNTSADKLIFTANTSSQNLSNVQFFSNNGTAPIGTGAGFYSGTSGQLVPVPEPAAAGAAMVLLGVIGCRECRRRRVLVTGTA